MNLRDEFSLWYHACLRSVPGEIGCLLRRRFSGLASCGHGTRILENVTIYYPYRLSIGQRVGIACGCQLNAAGGLTIGDDCLIGPGCFLWSQNHRYVAANIPVREQGFDRAPVVLEPDCWVAAGCVILPGVTLGRGTIVAAGAVVTRSTEPYSVVGGVPAKLIGQRKDHEHST